MVMIDQFLAQSEVCIRARKRPIPIGMKAEQAVFQGGLPIVSKEVVHRSCLRDNCECCHVKHKKQERMPPGYILEIRGNLEAMPVCV